MQHDSKTGRSRGAASRFHRLGHALLAAEECWNLSYRFLGTTVQLRRLIATAGVQGRWRDIEGAVQFRARGGGVLNFWPSTRTLCFQGKPPVRDRLEARFIEV